MGSIKNTHFVGNHILSSLLIALFIIVPFAGVAVPVTHAIDIQQTVEISNCTELQAIADTYTEGKFFQLTQNIDCSDTINWNSGSGFSPLSLEQAVFDGQGYTISDVYIDTTTSSAGLFSSVSGSLIQDLVLEDFDIRSSYTYANAGLLAASLSGKSAVWGVHARGAVELTSAYNYSYVGGLVGHMQSGTGIYRSSFIGTINRENRERAGGLVGSLEQGFIADSYASSTIFGASKLGGLVGVVAGDSIVERSFANGTIEATGVSIGGLFGQMFASYEENLISVQDSFAAMAFVGGSDVGGVTGLLGEYASFDNVYYDSYLAGGIGCTNQGSADGCTAKNIDEEGPSEPAYFYTITNEPFLQWDFDAVWEEQDGAYPTLKNVPDTIDPGAPTNLEAEAQGNFIVFSWDAPIATSTFSIDTGNRYEVQVKSSSDEWVSAIFSDRISAADYEETYDEENPEWLVPGLEQDTTYDIRVRAYDQHVLSSDWVTTQATTGTPGDVSISSCVELQKIGNDPDYTNIDNYTLTQDIDCSDTVNWNEGAGFKQIGDQRIHFWGSFDGSGYTISDLYIDRPEEYYVGLFGVVQGDASVSDLIIADADITGAEYVGVLAGALSGTVTNATTTGAVEGSYYVGGLVGAHLDFIGIGNSSPLVYTWNGEEYVYVADVGQMIGRGTDGVDYATIDKENLVPKGDKYELNISQEYNEIVYYDAVALKTYDHAPGYRVAQSFLRSAGADDVRTVADEPTHPLQSCTDMYGNNCLNDLESFDDKWSYKDRSFVNSWTMNFGDLSGADSIQLVVRAARDYAAESDRDVRTIEVKNAEGNWVVVYNKSQIGSDGTPRLRTIDMTDKFLSDDYSVRITLNEYNVNYVAIDTSAQQPVTVNTYAPTKVDLSFRGYTAMDKTYFWDHDYTQVSPYPEQPFAPQGGNFTKYGSVTPLLQDADDQFVIMRHGDHMAFEFPYVRPVEEGLERSFVLFNDVVYKHADEETGNAVYPLPFDGMTEYPYGESESYPMTSENVEYLNTWNTRSYPIVESHSSTIYDSSADVTVQGYSDVGGLVGDNEKNIYRSHATGNVTGEYYVGGLVGDNNYVETIEQSYATGDVTGVDYVGGLMGEFQGGVLSESYTTGDVTGESYVGGLVGMIYSDAVVSDSYARGTVTGNYYVGGFVGYLDYGTIENSYSTGAPSGEESVGGFVGLSNESTATNSFWDIETSGTSTSANGTGTTTLAMKDIDTFTTDLGEDAWDFTEIWGIDTEVNNGYPYFLFAVSEDDEEEEEEPGEPVVVTGDASSITRTGVWLNAEFVDASGQDIFLVGIELGTTTSYGSSLHQYSDGNPTEYSLEWQELTCATTYHYRAFVGLENDEKWYGEDATFRTSNCPASSGGSGGGSTAAAVAKNAAENTPANNATVLASLRAQLAQLMAKLAEMTGQPTTPVQGVRDLENGMEGEDVKQLQQLLIAQGYAIPAGATGVFANQTVAALSKYQADKGITPSAGYFGEKTRAQMKAAGLTGLWW